MNVPCPRCGVMMFSDDPEVVPIRHASNGECVKALRAEVERLRAKLAANDEYVANVRGIADYVLPSMTATVGRLEKRLAARDAEVAALRGFAESLNHHDWARQAMFNHGLIDTAGSPTALLTGERRGG